MRPACDLPRDGLGGAHPAELEGESVEDRRDSFEAGRDRTGRPSDGCYRLNAKARDLSEVDPDRRWDQTRVGRAGSAPASPMGMRLPIRSG